MSLKGVELQIAIPKTFEAGKMAEQNQQNVNANLANAHEAMKREIERKQKIVNTSEGTDEINSDEERGNEHLPNGKKNRKKHEDEEKHNEHPFKGNFFDFSG